MRKAIQLAGRLLDAGDDLRRRPGTIGGIASPTLNVTRLCGGELFGLAPGTIELLTDRRVMPSEDTHAAVAEYLETVAAIQRELGFQIDVEVVRVAEPLRPAAHQTPWAELVRAEAVAVLAHDVPLVGIPLFTDARWFGAHGVPTVLYGAGSDDLVESGINGQDENLEEADLLAATEIIGRLVTRTLLESVGEARPSITRDSEIAPT